MNRLTKIINNRPVAVLLPGPSLVKIKDLDGFCLASVNHYWVIEKLIGRRIEVLLTAAVENKEYLTKYIDFLKRKNSIILTTDAFLPNLPEKYKDKLLLFKTDEPNVIRQVPTKEEPLTFRALASFSLLLFLLTIAGAKKITLFGADGGELKGYPLYIKDWPSDSLGRLMMDTRILNQAFPIILRRVCKLYNLELPTILNMSPESYYTCFEKVKKCGRI